MLDLPALTLVSRAIVGSLTWGFATVIYIALKRKGIKSFGRFTAFWMGTPTTWVSFFLVSEGRRVPLQPAADNEEALFADLRSGHRRHDPEPHEVPDAPHGKGRS